MLEYHLSNFISFVNGKFLLTIVDQDNFDFSAVIWVNDPSCHIYVVVKGKAAAWGNAAIEARRDSDGYT